MSNLSKVLISFSLLAMSITANAQKIKVSGVVTDEAGETVIGATIMEKGTKSGTITDFDGAGFVHGASFYKWAYDGASVAGK